LQRRIDKVLEDAAALATQASTAQRKTETAVQRVEDLEGQVSVMQASIDQNATRLASLEADAVFALEQEEEPAVAEAAETESTETAETDGGSSAALETPALTELLDADGVPVPLPKDRTIIAPPSREVTTEVEVADATAEVINVLQTEAPTLAAVEGASRLEGELPIFPSARPEPPIRSINPPSPEVVAAVTGTFGDLVPVPAANSSRSSSATSDFDVGKRSFNAGNYLAAIGPLQGLIDQGGMGARAAEVSYMLGTSFLRTQQYTSAIQILAVGLRNHPSSQFAGTSLVNLADALQANNQATESCRLLSFVPIEYPNDAQAISDANSRAVQFSC
jgi:TolA-binding protein